VLQGGGGRGAVTAGAPSMLVGAVRRVTEDVVLKEVDVLKSLNQCAPTAPTFLRFLRILSTAGAFRRGLRGGTVSCVWR
jgi:hypothetical protein